MSAFESAWDLVKQYAPNWREVAIRLPRVGIEYDHDNVPILDGEDPFDGQYYTNEGAYMTVIEHPHDERFVMKVPKINRWHQYEPSDTIAHRMGADRNSRGQPLAEILETLGFPVVSEMDEGEYTVMPRLTSFDTVDANPFKYPSYNAMPMRDSKKTLSGIVGDTHSGNFAMDQANKWRMIDVDLSRPASPWWPLDDPELGTTGQQIQNHLNESKIQLPASKILNILDMGDYQHDGMRAFMEAIEPYSDNPRFVTVDGRPIWREGYDSL